MRVTTHGSGGPKDARKDGALKQGTDVERHRDIRVYKDLEGLSEAALNLFLEVYEEKVREKGVFTVALSGGRTPDALFRLLSTERVRERVRWEKVHFFWGDERCVPPDSAESNYGAAFRSFISKAAVPAENVHRIEGELSPTVAASRYEKEIKEFFGGKPAVFDLVFLGLGDDGHTLSLFPSTRALNETKRLVVENYADKLGAWRVTMTLPLVNVASNLVFMVSGGSKSAVLKEVLEGVGDHPAGRIRVSDGRVVWLVDKDAAGDRP